MTKTIPHPKPRGVFGLLSGASFRSPRTKESDLKEGAWPGAGRLRSPVSWARPPAAAAAAAASPAAPQVSERARRKDGAGAGEGRRGLGPQCRRRRCRPSPPRGCAPSRAGLPCDARSRPTESANVNTARGNGVWPPADPNALYGPRSRHSPRVSAVVATRVRAPRQWRSGGYLRTNQGVM